MWRRGILLGDCWKNLRNDNEDEMFFVVSGQFKIRDKTVELQENEFLIVPKGVEHRPVAESEVSVMLFEPNTTLNTGNTTEELTRENIA